MNIESDSRCDIFQLKYNEIDHVVVRSIDWKNEKIFTWFERLECILYMYNLQTILHLDKFMVFILSYE